MFNNNFIKLKYFCTNKIVVGTISTTEIVKSRIIGTTFSQLFFFLLGKLASIHSSNSDNVIFPSVHSSRLVIA